MYKHKLDPIRYAWEHRNPGMPFPSALGRSRDSPLAAPSLVTPWRYELPPSRIVSGDAAVAAALYSWAAPHNDTPERAQTLSANNKFVARTRPIHGTYSP